MSVIPSTAKVSEKSIPLSPNSNTLYVGGDGPGNYSKIQYAINDASDGDTVFVYNGTYYENLFVSKSINLKGENKDSTKIYGDWESFSVVNISADWVNISGFKISSSGEDEFCGIKIHSCFNNISSNIFEDNWFDVSLSKSSNNNTIVNNLFIDLYSYSGIELTRSNNNVIKNNDFSYKWFAIYLSKSRSNKISDNNFLINTHAIILEDYCMNNYISGNLLINISCCTCIGISTNSNNNILFDNKIKMNSYWGQGIGIYKSKDNSIIGNIIKNCGTGINLFESKDNNILCNRILNCEEFGVKLYNKSQLEYMDFNTHFKGIKWENINCNNIINKCCYINQFTSCSDNIIHHNDFLNNNQNAKDKCNNKWDNDYPSGGNYWDDYNGTDENEDGIGDIPYNISGGDNQDRYPLMEQWGFKLLPIAKFTWKPLIPDPGETIIFNASESIDFDGVIILYEWDWNHDGEYDENHTNPTANYTYDEFGYYPVTLRIHDNNSFIGTKTKIVRVGNHPPFVPCNPHPPNNSIAGTLGILCWTGGDPDGDNVYYDVYFGNNSSPPKIISNITSNCTDLGTLEFDTTYYWKIVAWDEYNASTEGPVWTFKTKVNQPPSKPEINGEKIFRIGESGEYTYKISSTDPDDDNIYYFIDWSNGSSTDWFGPFKSGKEVSRNIYINAEEKGTYSVFRIKAKDEFGAESNWATLEITVPKTYLFNIWWLNFLLNRFPLLQRLLEILIR
jgi:parallel beta-helix repeat protein